MKTVSDKDLHVLQEIIAHAESSTSVVPHGEHGQMSLADVLKSYSIILRKHGLSPSEDTFFYRLLLQMSMDGSGDWWRRLEAVCSRTCTGGGERARDSTGVTQAFRRMVTERIPTHNRRGVYEGSGLVAVHSRGWTKRFNDENDISVYHGNAQNRKAVKKKKDENQRMVEEQALENWMVAVSFWEQCVSVRIVLAWRTLVREAKEKLMELCCYLDPASAFPETTTMTWILSVKFVQLNLLHKRKSLKRTFDELVINKKFQKEKMREAIDMSAYQRLTLCFSWMKVWTYESCSIKNKFEIVFVRHLRRIVSWALLFWIENSVREREMVLGIKRFLRARRRMLLLKTWGAWGPEGLVGKKKTLRLRFHELKRKIAKKVFREAFMAISEDLSEQAIFAEHGNKTVRKKFYNQWLQYVSLMSESNLKLEEKLTAEQGKRRRRVLESWSRHVGRMKMLMEKLATAELKFKVKIRRKQLKSWKQKTSFLMRLKMFARIMAHVSTTLPSSYAKIRWRMRMKMFLKRLDKLAAADRQNKMTRSLSSKFFKLWINVIFYLRLKKKSVKNLSKKAFRWWKRAREQGTMERKELEMRLQRAIMIVEMFNFFTRWRGQRNVSLFNVKSILRRCLRAWKSQTAISLFVWMRRENFTLLLLSKSLYLWKEILVHQRNLKQLVNNVEEFSMMKTTNRFFSSWLHVFHVKTSHAMIVDSALRAKEGKTRSACLEFWKIYIMTNFMYWMDMHIRYLAQLVVIKHSLSKSWKVFCMKEAFLTMFRQVKEKLDKQTKLSCLLRARDFSLKFRCFGRFGWSGITRRNKNLSVASYATSAQRNHNVKRRMLQLWWTVFNTKRQERLEVQNLAAKFAEVESKNSASFIVLTPSQRRQVEIWNKIAAEFQLHENEERIDLRKKSSKMQNVFVAFKKATLFQVVTTALKLQSVLVLKQWIISHKHLFSRDPAFFQVLFKMRLLKAMRSLFSWHDITVKTRECNLMINRHLSVLAVENLRRWKATCRLLQSEREKLAEAENVLSVIKLNLSCAWWQRLQSHP
ncbi:hypothetical protein GUITHDRAFT_120602 [Guillardia theta CCMP2712]|uniref:Sfi1 spindle body domain-containing protein n=1 Tax=Guillardia theta (strain CCMP2712) TaxID=905079 RepID=L1IAE5_GUITC|nr:hypothetical protein GUITHDRAFT_120602 [Guillardia theta CCMP2712]EKX33203.1 hypothetical protein GUITHDRAFT_120602 [Guillardia theta CCMP2712]|eukprot:XP_005820183.1 hypothetical protein GUITHDRAFT_120602 [Guillardia theta CCMP2712]